MKKTTGKINGKPITIQVMETSLFSTRKTLNTDVQCGGCNGYPQEETSVPHVYICNGCGGYIGSAIREDLLPLVNLNEDGFVDGEATRYFDITVTNGDEIYRVHGWVNDAGQVVQYG